MKTLLLLVLFLARRTFEETITISKCCMDNEKLDSDLKKCVAFKEHFNAPKTLAPPMNEGVAFWIPPYLRSSNIKYWNGLNNSDSCSFTAVIAADNKTVSNFLRIDGGARSFVLDVFQEDLSNYKLQEQNFCFDATDNSLLPHVIRTVVSVRILDKCCSGGKHLNRYLSRCENRPREEENKMNEDKAVVERIENTNNSTCALSTFMGKKWNLQYSKKFQIDYISNVIAFKIEDENYFRNTNMEENEFAGWPKSLISVVKKFRFPHFCFDTVKEGKLSPKVLLLYPEVNVIQKCCLPGEMLSDKGFCVVDKEDTPRNSSLGSIVELHKIIFGGLMFGQCMQNRYETKALKMSDKSSLLLNKYDIASTFNWIFYCVDWQNTEDGTKEVLGKCRLPSNVELYESVRPLGTISAMFLLAAIVASLVRKQTRTSAHGWALICHALCLAIVNTLQVTWFFASKPNEDCSLYAYPTYYFMVAGNVWLSVIAGNMLYGFRNPLQALASRDGGGSDVAVTCKRFAVMSFVAWGITAALTALSVMKYQGYAGDTIIKNPSTFLETRLCLREVVFGPLVKSTVLPNGYVKNLRMAPNIYGSLFYYYIPVALLVVGNAGCVIFVGYQIRVLNQDQAFLHADYQHGSSNFQSALVYVKLLLLTGVLELSLEIVALSIRLKENGEVKARFEYTVQVAESTHYFTIAATFLDICRAIGVLWLCTGWKFRFPEGWLFWWKPFKTRCLQSWRKPHTSPRNTASSNIQLAETVHL